MKYMLKGLALGLSLNIADRFCDLFYGLGDFGFFLSGVVFYIIITLFLLSDNISHMLLTGFSGIFFMFFGEIFIFMPNFSTDYTGYYAGLIASVFSIVTAYVIIQKNIEIKKFIATLLAKREFSVDKDIQGKLLVYLIVTAVLFVYLVLPENAGIGVLIFAVIQFVFLCYIVPDKKRLILYAPIFAMALNCYISASTIWRMPNLILSVILIGCMFVRFDVKADSLNFIPEAISHIFVPFSYFKLPFNWSMDISNKKAPVIKRVGIALAITIPCIIILTLTLSKADMVFSSKTNDILDKVFSLFNANVLIKVIVGMIVEFYIFGAVCNSYKKADVKIKLPQFKGDMIIINIVLASILFVYTMFVIIQFKYLFAGKVLPDGFTYTEYARKGFFELLALTGVNIAVILTVVKLTKQHSGKWLLFTKILCHYLCAVTVVLLASSYFRMNLYVIDDGLTRLRLFVIGFLAFELIGLLITFLYIAKPKFNLALVYFVIALVYYMVLNAVPADYIIAKNQISRYLKGTRNDIDYVFTLSADVAPALKELREQTDDEAMLNNIYYFLEDNTKSDIPNRWQRYNLSVQKAKNIIK